MNIVKDPATRLITFSRSGQVVQTLGEEVTGKLNANRNGLLITDLRGKSIELITSQVDTYQLLPNPFVKFQPQGTGALWDLLFDPNGLGFFTDLRIKFGGGGGVVNETNVKIIPGPTYTALTTDYILVITGDCTITLPLIAAPRIAFPYRIFCRNVKVTVQATAPDLINGAASFTMKKYDQVTIRALQANDWGLGD